MADTLTPAQQALNLSEDEKKHVAQLLDKIEAITKSRSRRDARVYVNGAFMENEHWMGFNMATGQLEREKGPAGQPIRQIHKGKKKMVQMKNTILADDPQIVVHPVPGADGKFSQELLDETTRHGDWLKDETTREDVSMKLDTAVYDATWQDFTTLWAWYNPQSDTYEIDYHDFFDVLCDPHVLDIQESSVVVRAFMKEKPELLANQSYDQKRAKAAQVEERWAANNWKNDRLNEQFGTTPSYKEPVKVYEVWQKVYCSPELKAKARKLKNGDNMTWLDECQEGQCCMYLATIAGGLLVRETYLPYHLYPCTAITLKDGKLIGPAPVEDIIAANKSLDVQVSRKEQYVNQVVAGRVLKHKSTKITRMTNAHGDFLEWDGNPTEAPVIMGIPDLPSVVQSLQNDTERFMDEATVMGNQLMNVVQGGRGAEAIESLKGADVESVSTGRKKVAYALQQLCEVLSMLADVHQSTKHQISRLQEDGQPKAFSIIGGRYADTQAFHQAYDGYEGLRPTVIRASAKVSVTIESGLAYTQQGKFNILQNLASMGALSVESLLTMLKVTGNVSQELRQILQESGRSMIDTEDFKALPPDFQVQVLQQLQQLNISMPVQAKNIGSTRNIDTPQVRS